MKWFKLDSDFIKDDKVIDCLQKHGKDGIWLWICIMALISERYEGNPKQKFVLSKNELRLFSRLKNNKLSLLLEQTKFIFGINLKQTDNKVEIEYPKFLKKQQKYFKSDEGKFKKVSPHKEEEEEREEDKEEDSHSSIARSDKPKRANLADSEFIDILKKNPAYEGIDIDRELCKIDAWLLTPRGRGKQKTRGRVINWLNNIDKPLKTDRKIPKFMEGVSEYAEEIKRKELHQGNDGFTSDIPQLESGERETKDNL